ncbi:MAG: NADH-quinone oxidoreductase subunit J [Gemmatimonadetes bacterium]|nr:NADH-quinone oxidoreductase subunit J [Gemmatimonadota bacterium]
MSALSLVLTLFALAGIYVLFDAHFIAVMQIIVYAGAIMVLFLFVIMLLNVGRPDAGSDVKGKVGKFWAGFLGAALIAEMAAMWRLLPGESFRLPAGTLAGLTAQRGAVGLIAEPLFRAYLVPFEITSVLLLAAVVGAVVLAKRKL